MASQGLAPTSIKVYLAALRNKQIALGFPDTAHTAMPKLKLISNGIARAKASTPNLATTVRQPITPHILQQLKAHWSVQPIDHTKIMLWAACTMAFFGFFRMGELTIPSAAAFNPAIHLTPADVAIDKRENPSLIQVQLKASKTDQLRRGVSIFIGKTGDNICPVAAISAYLAVRGADGGPFFRFPTGEPLTKENFTKHVRAALTSCGFNPALYAGHSFRIGAATTAAERGIEDSTIKALGRWKSDAFQAYIKIPREKLAAMSKVLSASTK